MRYVLCVMCHLSCVMCHMSKLFFIPKKIRQSGGARRFKIYEPLQIWVCAVSVYSIDYQSQNLCLPLNTFLAVTNINI